MIPYCILIVEETQQVDILIGVLRGSCLLELVIRLSLSFKSLVPLVNTHLPSLSRMSTVTVSPPGTNEAGAVTLPETTKLSVPSTRESSMLLTEALWVLPVVDPWSNVTFCLSRWKSSPLHDGGREQQL